MMTSTVVKHLTESDRSVGWKVMTNLSTKSRESLWVTQSGQIKLDANAQKIQEILRLKTKRNPWKDMMTLSEVKKSSDLF